MIVTLSSVILISTLLTKLHGPLSRVYDVEVVGEKVLPPTAFAVAAHGRGFRV